MKTVDLMQRVLSPVVNTILGCRIMPHQRTMTKKQILAKMQLFEAALRLQVCPISNSKEGSDLKTDRFVMTAFNCQACEAFQDLLQVPMGSKFVFFLVLVQPQQAEHQISLIPGESSSVCAVHESPLLQFGDVAAGSAGGLDLSSRQWPPQPIRAQARRLDDPSPSPTVPNGTVPNSSEVTTARSVGIGFLVRFGCRTAVPIHPLLQLITKKTPSWWPLSRTRLSFLHRFHQVVFCYGFRIGLNVNYFIGPTGSTPRHAQNNTPCWLFNLVAGVSA